MGISIVTILFYFTTVWLTTIDFFFKNDGKIMFYYENYSLTMMATLINITFRCIKFKKESETTHTFFEIVRSEFLSVTVIIYTILKMIGINNRT